MILFLTILDLIWSLLAWFYDWQKLFSIPFYLVPFILTCPVYPLLLAIIWYQIYKKRSLNAFIYYIAVIVSVMYGALALFYYPSQMVLYGFDWLTFGAIFWVLVYALQGGYLLLKIRPKFNLISFLVAIILIFEKIIIDYVTRTSDYIIDKFYPQSYLNWLFFIALIIFITVSSKIFYNSIYSKNNIM